MRLTPVVPLLINFALGIRGRQESLRIVALLSQASIEAFQQALPVSLPGQLFPDRRWLSYRSCCLPFDIIS